MENELISVIVPVYGVEKYLEKCAASLMQQSYKNIEIIFVDDCSPDKSEEILAEVSKIDKRIKVIRNKVNSGLSFSRNAGLEAANGKYIVFIDSDDYVNPYMIEKLYKRLKTDHSDMSLCSFAYVNENGVILDNEQDNPIRDGVITGQKVLMQKFFEERNWYWIVAWNKLYRKELFENTRFPNGKIHEDEFIAHLIYHNCQRVSCISDKLYMYRQRENSIMKLKDAENHLDASEAYVMRANFFVSNGYCEKLAIRCLIKAIQEFEKYCFMTTENYNLAKISHLQGQYRDICKKIWCKDRNLKIISVLIRNYIGMYLNYKIKCIFRRKK